MMLLTACHGRIWDAIDDLDSRVAKLEELCKEMNTNISSLQTIVSVIQENDYITGVLPIEKGGEVIGYTITFGKHDPITIYNGEDGKDSQNGSGSTPIIGVAKYTDGVYYWTLNGEWLLDDEGNKLPVSGKNGNDGENGEEGKDGQNGQDGKPGVDGKDGVTPQLKIENGYWYVSYDNGITWVELGKAVGENGKDGANGTDGKDGQDGKPGADGKNGDSMFTSVTYDENYVYFTLTDGSVLIVPRGKNSGTGENDPSDIIKFEDLNVKSALLQMNIDTNGDGEISYAEAANYKGNFSMSNTNILSFKEFQYFTGVTSVNFGGCSELFEIILPNTIDTIVGFSGCSKLTSFKYPENLKYIGDGAFRNCGITNANLPNSVEYIGKEAFVNCPLVHFTYPQKLKQPSIPYINLRNSSSTYGIPSLTSITWNCENEIILKVKENGYYEYSGIVGRWRDDYAREYIVVKNIQNIMFGEQVTAIPASFCHGAKIETITIPDNIISIGASAFNSCSSLKSVTIPNSVTSIGAAAFSSCSSLTSILIPNSITTIEECVFMSCSALTSITIGNNVTQIKTAAFSNCSSLYLIYSKNPVPPTLGINAFAYTKIGIIYVPKASVDVYKAAWSDYADKIVGYDF